MWDIGCVAASLAFFIIAIAYTSACDLLSAKGAKKFSKRFFWASSSLAFSSIWCMRSYNQKSFDRKHSA
jgi:hypothetical protein